MRQFLTESLLLPLGGGVAGLAIGMWGSHVLVTIAATQIPGVRAVGLISLLPLQNSDWSGGLTIAGRPEVLQSELRYVTPGYFRAMGIPLRRGREFSPRDGPGVPRVILVNEALARQYFPNEDPVGRSTDRGTIIGVVGDVRQATLSVPGKPEIYYTVAQNFAQIRRHGSTVAVRGHGPQEALVGAIRGAVREVSPGQALFRVAACLAPARRAAQVDPSAALRSQ